jgi:hypothetical protein
LRADPPQERFESFLLNGISTTRHDLVTDVERLRVASEARWSLLLVFSEDRGVRLLQSVTVLTVDDERTSQRLASLAHELIPHRRRFAHDDLLAQLTRRQPRLDLLQHAIELSDLPKPIIGKVLGTLRAPGPVASTEPQLGRNFPRLRMVVVAGTSRSRLARSTDELRRLTLGVATSQTIQSFETIAAAQRIDDRVTDYERDLASEQISGLEELGKRLRQTEDQIVDLARQATEGDYATLYDRQADGSDGLLASRSSGGGQEQRPMVIPELDSNQPQQPAMAGIVRRRPLIANSPDDYSQLNLVDVPQSHPVIVVPIPQPLDLSYAAPIGVLEIGRQEEPFRVVDLQLARIASIRIAQARLQHLVASLTRARLAFRMQGASQRPEVATPLSEPPSEWSALASGFTKLLDEAMQVFGCMSISLRVQSLDGRSLVRLAASPDARMHDRGRVLPIPRSADDPHGSTVAEVCRTGRPRQVTNVDQHRADHGDRWFDARGGVGSALCLPVSAMGRICGTLNIELASLGSGDGQVGQPFSQPFQAVAMDLAETFGAGLDAATASSVNRAQSVAFGTAIRAHQLQKSLVELRSELSKGKGKLDQSVVTAVLNTIEPLLNTPFSAKRDARGTTLLKLVRSCVREAEIAERTDVEIPAEGFNLRGRTVREIRYPLVELLLNARLASQNQSMPIRISAIHGVWAGARCCFVEISNPVAGRLDARVTSIMYRSAVARDRGGWGAYLAAERIRSAGGDVFLTSADMSEITTTIRLPLSKRRTSGG